MSEKSKRLLSIIIPCYKQENTIGTTIHTVETILKALPYDFEIIIVIDGIVDDSDKKAKEYATAYTKVVSYQHNRGKGYALRYGMARTKGDIIAFIDAGGDLNPEGLKMLIAHFDWYNADIVVGSKWHPVSKVHYPPWRIILSKGYGLLVKILFHIPVKDTQLGMKCFRREVLTKVMPRLLVKKYAFDIEMLAVANRLGFKRIYEAPVDLNWSHINSHISKNLLTNTIEMFVDTFAVYYRLNIMKYYDDVSKQKWRYDPDLNFRVNTG